MANHTLLITSAVLVAFAAGAAKPTARYTTYNEAAIIIQSLGSDVPPEVRSFDGPGAARGWDEWVRKQDAGIRARLIQGDEDSLVNMMLFGTSFTRRPRITLETLAKVGQIAGQAGGSQSEEALQFIDALRARAEDLVNSLVNPGSNERLVFARHLIESQGYKLTDPAGRSQAVQFLYENFSRILTEQTAYGKTLERARLLGSATQEFSARSTLFQTRGLSSDTSLLPDFAIDRTLEVMKERKLLTEGSVSRVAIIGPGLDFTDKQDGYDFYPLQTIQPFAVIDSLLRFGLAKTSRLRVTTLDISERVNLHIERAVARARAGTPYSIQLPRDPSAGWKPELVRYWAGFGEAIGRPGKPITVPVGLPQLRLRSVRVHASIVSLIAPEDLNIVLQRLDLPSDQKFDLVIATNMFVYYTPFEQALALANVNSMLKDNGYLLSNNALPELAATGMRSGGYNTVIYSDKPDDGDHVVWYQHTSGGR
ncbi:MAG: class I SAM-dependent methyltransferase [Blastocatellia bacterium]